MQRRAPLDRSDSVRNIRFCNQPQHSTANGKIRPQRASHDCLVCHGVGMKTLITQPTPVHRQQSVGLGSGHQLVNLYILVCGMRHQESARAVNNCGNALLA